MVNLNRYLVLTNRHVLEENDEFTVLLGFDYTKHYKFKDQEKTTSDNICIAKYYDIGALIFESSNKYPVLSDTQNDFLENIRNVNLGEVVYSIGSPGGEENFATVAKGSVINTNEPVLFKGRDYCTLDRPCNGIKTNANLGKGSSGGALFSRDGKLIGINFAGSKDNKYSFHIPLKDARVVIEQILKIFNDD